LYGYGFAGLFGLRLVQDLPDLVCQKNRQERFVEQDIALLQYTVLGDYVAGPSHTLPTGGAGRSFAGLTVDQFQRRTSVVEYTRGALKQAVGGVRKFAQLEGLDAHGRSAAVRVEDK